MKNKITALQEYYVDILNYLKIKKPPLDDRLHFLGALINSMLDDVKLTCHEKDIYLDIYTILTKKKINEIRTIEDEPKFLLDVEQPEGLTV